MSESKPWKPSKLNKILGALWCGALLRKGPMCCTTNCSCFNDVENPHASQARADEARWKYRSEKLADRQESRAQAAERREARRENKKERKIAKAKAKSASRTSSSNNAKSSYDVEDPISQPAINSETPPTTQPAVQSGITEKEVPAGTIEPESAVDTIPVPGTQSEEISTRAQAKADKKAKLHEKRKLRKDNRIERRKHKKERGMK